MIVNFSFENVTRKCIRKMIFFTKIRKIIEISFFIHTFVTFYFVGYKSIQIQEEMLKMVEV